VEEKIPNAARVYDYTLGGTHNFEADRQAAEFMFSLIPSTRKWVRMLRASLQQAAKQLSKDGFKHYVDFASGLPTGDHIHGVLPGAKVIYSDKDPLSCKYAQELLGDNPNVRYLQNDIRNAKELLLRSDVQEFLEGNRKVAFVANGVTVFLTAEENSKFFRDLYEWAAPGSKLFECFETKNPNLTTPRWEQFLGMFRQMGEPFHMYSLEEYLKMHRPWSPCGDGPMPLAKFLGLPADHITEADREGLEVEYYAVIMEKKPA
jgi:hypothetical protein